MHKEGVGQHVNNGVRLRIKHPIFVAEENFMKGNKKAVPIQGNQRT